MVAAINEREQVFGHVTKPRLVRNVLVSDAMHVSRRWRDRHGWVESQDPSVASMCPKRRRL
jgi:hypothetical protein